MKLTCIKEGMWPINVGNRQEKDYIYYIDMDGVLVDLAAGLRGSKYHWKTPEALVQMIGATDDPEATRKFYLSLPKTQEADAIWKEANKLAPKGVYILTAVPNIAGLDEAKMEWVLDNLSPPPRDILMVGHRQKSQYAKGPESILVDDDLGNIKQWTKAGGSGILHIPGSTRGTLQRMQVPEGTPDVDIDLSSPEGIATSPALFRGGGRAGYRAKFTKNNVDYHMRVNTVQIPIPNTDDVTLEILGVLSADDMAVDVIKRLKNGNLSRPQILAFIDDSADSVVAFTKQNYTQIKFDNIIVPQSNSKLAALFAAAIAKKLGITSIIPVAKNKNASAVTINQSATTQVAQTLNTYVNTPKRKANPNRLNYPRGDNRRYEWSANDVEQLWQKQVQGWINGTISTKQLDPLLRRNNLSDLYVPPNNFDQLVAGKCNMIVDDVTAYRMTITDIAKMLVDHGSSAEVGVVLWMV